VSNATIRHLTGNSADADVPVATCPRRSAQRLDLSVLGWVDDPVCLTADQRTPYLGQRLVEGIDFD
jgi:hypothetical protein